jgi:hypothetical protein
VGGRHSVSTALGGQEMTPLVGVGAYSLLSLGHSACLVMVDKNRFVRDTNLVKCAPALRASPRP